MGKTRRRRAVDPQDVRVVNSRVDASHGGRSPYWDDVEKARGGHESDRANPDLLPGMASSPSSPQFLMGEAVEHLQGRQKEVYLLTMREGKSLAETAEILGIEKASAQVYKARAVKFIQKYCKEAIDRGRV